MPLNRVNLALGSSSTTLSAEYSNELINKVNNIVENVSTRSSILGHISGVKLTYQTATTVDVSPGVAWSDCSITPIKLTSTLTLNMNIVGLNGLDAGSRTSNTWYYVFLISNSSGLVRVVASVSNVSPVLPIEYMYKRLIGVIRTDGSNNIWNFFQSGSGSVRDFMWNTPQSILSTTSLSMTLTNISVTSSTPINVTRFGWYAVQIYASWFATSTTESVTYVLPKDVSPTSTGTFGVVELRTGLLNTRPCSEAAEQALIPCSSDGFLSYSCSGNNQTITIRSTGFRLEL